MKKIHLMSPGPTELPPEVLAVGSQQIPHHRTPVFRSIFNEVCQQLKIVFQTESPVLVLSVGGTGGMEACITNLSKVGDKIIVITGGVFGERWAKIGEAFGRNVIRVIVPWGEAVDLRELYKAIKLNPDAIMVCGTLVETSTGVEHPIKEIARLVAQTPACFVLDAISGIAASELKTDEWKVDVVVAGTQKGLMIPPGLSLISLSEKAQRRLSETESDVFYLSFKKALHSLLHDKNPDTPWTPNISLILQLDASLKLIIEEGMEKVWERHQLLAEAVRAGVVAMGLQLFAPDNPSPSVTAVCCPVEINGELLVKIIRDDWGISIVGGQGDLNKKVFRIGHLGYCDRSDVLMTLSVLEIVLYQLGFPVHLGEGVAAAQQLFLKEVPALVDKQISLGV